MTFLEAVVAISKRTDLHLCEDPTELNGTYKSICVYKYIPPEDENAKIYPLFVGKLRWPDPTRIACPTAHGDDELIEELTKEVA